VRHNYSFFPILVDPEAFGIDRNRLFDMLRACNVYPRKYFFPLCSRYPCYSALPSANSDNLPVATRVADRVLCLPLYGRLDESIVEKICSIVVHIHESVTENRR
jgi:dTDP-4-amino-4,6-dideoxygalactose transaminase